MFNYYLMEYLLYAKSVTNVFLCNLYYFTKGLVLLSLFFR